MHFALVYPTACIALHRFAFRVKKKKRRARCVAPRKGIPLMSRSTSFIFADQKPLKCSTEMSPPPDKQNDIANA
jgi:hypothetical protein